jgi:DNA-directed RNA polymerase subunit RPC12/RpoP
VFEEVFVVCPGCRDEFSDFVRLSFNLGTGERWAPEEIEEQSTASCPVCGERVRVDGLIAAD